MKPMQYSRTSGYTERQETLSRSIRFKLKYRVQSDCRLSEYFKFLNKVVKLIVHEHGKLKT